MFYFEKYATIIIPHSKKYLILMSNSHSGTDRYYIVCLKLGVTLKKNIIICKVYLLTRAFVALGSLWFEIADDKYINKYGLAYYIYI